MIPTNSTARAAGRPRTTSRQMLEDAAQELFIETGYAATTIDQVTQRAGVSRNTFFNYFDSKSDLLWVEMDSALDRLAVELRDASPELPALAAIRSAMIRVAQPIGTDRVPLAFTEEDVMGTREETRSSGLVRLARRADVVGEFLARRLARDPRDLLVLSAANAIAGSVSAAWTVWALDGPARGPLVDYVAAALDAVLGGLDRAFT